MDSEFGLLSTFQCDSEPRSGADLGMLQNPDLDLNPAKFLPQDIKGNKVLLDEIDDLKAVNQAL